MALPLNSKTVTAIKSHHRLRHMPPLVKSILCHLCRMLSAALTGFTIVVLVRLLLSLALKPHFPIFQLDSATVTVTAVNSTTSTLDFNFTFIFRNPNNKLSVSYKELEANVWFVNDDITLASTRLPPLSQGTESATRVRAQLTVAEGIAKGRVRGSVNFGVSLLGLVRFRYGLMHSRIIRLRVECDQVLVVFNNINNGTTGNLVGPSYCCVVN